jgi:hypothetical protein
MMVNMSNAIIYVPKGNETLIHHKLKLLYCTKENIKTESTIQIDNYN